MYVRGDLSNEALAFEVSSKAKLDEVARCVLAPEGSQVREGSRSECDDRHVGSMYGLDDRTGNRVELVHGPLGPEECVYSRDAGITSFSHVGLRTTDAPRDEHFWTQRLGARVSDWIGDAALLRIAAVHHKIALPVEAPWRAARQLPGPLVRGHHALFLFPERARREDRLRSGAQS